MSNRFHSKWHRTSHQTYKHPDILDAGWDPIASHDVPFSGDFVMAPSVSGWCVSAEKNSLGDIYSWSPNNVITIDAHHDPSAEPPDPDNSTINLVAGIINFDINETNINGHLNVRDWVEISGMSGDGDTGYGLIVHESAVISGETSAVGKVTIDDNLYVIGTGEGCGSAYFNAISATEATIVSALIKEVDISASESNGYIMKTPNPQGKIIPNPLPGTGDAGKNNFYLSGDTLYSDSWGYFEGELKTASALYADGPVTFANTLNVNGNTDIGGTLDVTGAVDFDSTLNVDGATTLNTLTATGAVDFDSTLNVSGDTTTKNLAVSGTLGVTGATTLSSTLGVTGATTLNSTLNVSGNTTTKNLAVSGTLGVTGATTLNNTLNVSGDTTLKNTAVSGTLGVTGATDLGSTLNVSGAVKLFDSLWVNKWITVGQRTDPGPAPENYSVAVGVWVVAGDYSYTQGENCSADDHSCAFGKYASASGYSCAEGYNVSAIDYSHAIGNKTIANSLSYAEGIQTSANYSSHAEGNSTIAGYTSHAEGNETKAENCSHAEGTETSAYIYSHAEGQSTSASYMSHAEGCVTLASAGEGGGAHAEGQYTSAYGNGTHTEGLYTVAYNLAEHAEGRYNYSHKATSSFGNGGNTLSSIGIGTGIQNRKNAVETMQDGKTYILNVGGYLGDNPIDPGVKDIATVISDITTSLGDINTILDAINGEVI